MGIRITGVGGYVPEKVVTNEELVRDHRMLREIVAKTGILERRVCAAGQAPSDMGTEAARRCLVKAGVDGSVVDATVFPAYRRAVGWAVSGGLLR